MIHKIKALYDGGNGLSMRQISQELGISRNSVKKYLGMEAEAISQSLDAGMVRSKKMDKYRDYIIYLLKGWPNLSAVKIMRKIREKEPEFALSSRSARRYIESLRGMVSCKQERYYQPVLDMVPGVQCQVDPGELRKVMVGGVETTVYFTVFVLSCSRLMYVGFSQKPLNTDTFIRMHDAAFRYFEGRPEECVYDQTKMVVLAEEYRELTLNEHFARYATHAGFTIRACEGYDPESKGKVEAGVKFVKQNGLYGEEFATWAELESWMAKWLEEFANARIHGTTGRVPREFFNHDEKKYMRPYSAPLIGHQDGQSQIRKADKTGLISWKSSKYSVPLVFQRSLIQVEEQGHELILHDLPDGHEIARHPLATEKGKIIKNTHHYRDMDEQIPALEKQIAEKLGEEPSKTLCHLVRKSAPKIYRDQLRGIVRLLSSLPDRLEPHVIQRLCDRPVLTATMVRDYLTALACKSQRVKLRSENMKQRPELLSCYQGVLLPEAPHAIH